MKTRDSCWRRYKIQETLYIGQWRLSPLQNRHHGTSHSSPNCHRQTCHTFLNLIDGLKSLPLSKVILVLGKDKNCRVPNMGFGAAESPGWFDVLPNTLCVRCDAWAGVLSWWGCQPPVAYSCLNHPSSFCGRMSKLNTKSDADLLLYMLKSFWILQPHHTHAQSMVSTTPTD